MTLDLFLLFLLRCVQEAERQRKANSKKTLGAEEEAQPGGLKLMDRLNDTASSERLND